MSDGGLLFFWTLHCERACTFVRTCTEPTGDARWLTEPCQYDGTRLQVFYPSDVAP